ncbi:NAD(P)-dependent oxidoreductase [Entomospira culicis]|uniref:NAD(P)-dependent oxidoreductase n=1 Tax=Entomospira culicis TaxID=2719989 RepID=A0A968KU91_9SPIO|nr:NAD(P)-dependent oxidoreductase [Entomospira culicis]NIZ18685.1 NAD(P)-dependent oxidoreductase [Entomospira culicis]NIZ68900.1 NAD(P)-dependent oxidoreductase [Entomospira culicis]WDI37493.1 NAD(P)-dependent oxidoreductase [Entomospira culicis]WDI39121.1 NAD(P)-dependent oxidoreductase [Entomospira culicis]
MALHVMDEANRCLQCKKPFCRDGNPTKPEKDGCPIRTNIPEVIRLFKENKLDEAGKLLFDNNPLSLVCSLVCDHESQCEGSCVLNHKGVPVHFSTIEHYISDLYSQKMQVVPAPSNGIRVGIIGSGPAGITIAIILSQMGYQVTIFESKEKIGGVLRYGIPAFRLPHSILENIEQRQLIDRGVKIRPNTLIGGAIGLDDLFNDGYKAIFVGTGVWKPNALKIKGETFGHVHYGINYLNSPDSFRLGKRVIVIGAGNAAMDVARTALRKGVEHLTCFSITSEVAASHYEFSYAQLEGVHFAYNKRPVEITDEGVIFIDVTQDEAGDFIDVAGTQALHLADSVIVSISQGPQNNLVKTTKGLEANQRGLLTTDDLGHTSRAGVFASGDVVRGARTVVEAVAHSKVVAKAMHEYMQSLPKA